ncbi:MAG: 2'-deoxycytidine 5'-triphosphate deaminase [Nanoarchaeota archaeon]
MALFSLDDFLQAEREEQLHVTEREEYSAFSLNVRLGRLYRRREVRAATMPETEMSQEQFLAEICEEVPLQGGVVARAGDFYLWQPVEELSLGEGLGGQVTSRSSWARLGVRVDSVSDAYFGKYSTTRRWKPLCTLKTWTDVLLKQGDALGQLFVNDGQDYCSDGHLQRMVAAGELVLRREGRTLTVSDLCFDHGMVLTMGENVQIYKKGVIEPGNSIEKHFTKGELGRTIPNFFRQGTFFLSASAEHVEIPCGYAGYVVEREPWGMSIPFHAHSNALYVGPVPVFQGRITFENTMIIDGYIAPGMMQSKLLLVPLRSPINGGASSRYNNQKGATLSRL